MASFERTFEGKRKSGDHQNYGIGYSRNALVDLANQVAEAASQCIGWDNTAADLVRDQDYPAGSRLQSAAEVFDAYFQGELAAVLDLGEQPTTANPAAARPVPTAAMW